MMEDDAVDKSQFVIYKYIVTDKSVGNPYGLFIVVEAVDAS